MAFGCCWILKFGGQIDYFFIIAKNFCANNPAGEGFTWRREYASSGTFCKISNQNFQKNFWKIVEFSGLFLPPSCRIFVGVFVLAWNQIFMQMKFSRNFDVLFIYFFLYRVHLIANWSRIPYRRSFSKSLLKRCNWLNQNCELKLQAVALSIRKRLWKVNLFSFAFCIGMIINKIINQIINQRISEQILIEFIFSIFLRTIYKFFSSFFSNSK